MARIRSIKPEIRRDKKLARVSRESRYTFVLLWTVCDDQGFFLAEPRQLLGELYPHDPGVTENLLESHLMELSDFLEFYQTEDGRVGKVRNFNKHQKIDNPSKAFLANVVKGLSPEPRDTLAKASRHPRESLSSGVLSPESRVLSPDQKKPRSKKTERETWITPYGEAWEAVYGGEPPWKQLVGALGKVHRKHGLEFVLPRWRYYLQSTEPQFTNPAKFASTVGSWEPKEEAAAMGFEDSDFFTGDK